VFFIKKKDFLNIFYQIGNFSLIRYLMKPYQGKAAILMYHRILPHEERARDKSPNANLIVSLRRFEEQMRFLSNNYKLISMDEIPEYLISGKDFAVAITFDDGYKDNLTFALPILKKYNVPATIYLSTRFPEKDCGIWWYELAEICDARKWISFVWEDKKYNIPLKTPSQKKRGFRKLRRFILSLDVTGKNSILDILRQGEKPRDYSDLCLTWDEIRLLDSEPLITIGAHTHSHCNLSTLSLSEAEFEINKSILLLEKNLGHKIYHFSFPYGKVDEACVREYEIGKKFGFRTAVTTIFSALNQNSNLHCLPRSLVREEDDVFNLKVKLSGWETFVRTKLKV